MKRTTRNTQPTIKLASRAGMISGWHQTLDALGISYEEHGGRSFCGRQHVVVLRGFGKEKYDFPTPDQLVDQAIRYILRVRRLQEQQQGKKAANTAAPKSHTGGHGEAQPDLGADESFVSNGIGSIPTVLQIVKEGGTASLGTTHGPTLFVIAGGLAAVMHAGRFKAVIARQFDPLKGACNWAINHMDAEYHPIAQSLLEHVVELERIYLEALPRVIQFLGVQYPDASEEELLSAAVSVLNEQVAPILSVLSIWGECFAQTRDGLYPELKYIKQTVRTAFNLMRTGDAQGNGDPKVVEAIKSVAFNVGDKFLARYADNGRSTIPGAAGPVGSHVINVDHDESPILAISLSCPYLHEVRHDYREDVVNLPEEQTSAVIDRIQRDHAAGKYHFEQETIKIGKQEVPAIALYMQIFGQTLSEEDADIPGGVMLSGPAYRLGMAGVFAALNARGRGVFNTNVFLRSRSYFAVNEEGELAFEPHMPDYPRALMIALALKNRGFDTAAADCVRLATQGAGVPLPKYVTWTNIDPKSKFKFTIKVLVSDLMQVAESAVAAIIEDPLPCLGGLAAWQFANFTQHHQDKVDILVKVLMNGGSTIPADIGDIYPNLVAAAAVTAFWGLVDDGKHPLVAIAIVEPNARKMLDTIADRMGEKPLVVDPDPTPATGLPTGPVTVPSTNAGDGSASSTTPVPANVPPASDTDAVEGKS